MRRVRVFAAPFVVTAALGGCKKESSKDDERPQPPRVKVDAQSVAVAPADAAPIPDAFEPDAEPGPERTARLGKKGKCIVLWDDAERDSVPCPADGPTLAFATVRDDAARLRYDLMSGTCRERPPWRDECPPRATCNPPVPEVVPCPPELLPVLHGSLAPTRQEGDRCWWKLDAMAIEYEVACPGAPPKKRDALVYDFGDRCFTADGDATLRVACPDEGAPIVVPVHHGVEQGNLYVQIVQPELACYGNVQDPSPQQVECPDELMPRLRDGLKSNRKDGKCFYEDVQVRCP